MGKKVKNFIIEPLGVFKPEAFPGTEGILFPYVFIGTGNSEHQAYHEALAQAYESYLFDSHYLDDMLPGDPENISRREELLLDNEFVYVAIKLR